MSTITNTTPIVYKITTIENNISNPILTKFHTFDGTIYQIIRDIDFMVNIKPCKNNQTFCIRLFKSEGSSNSIIGDFYFNIPEEIFIHKEECPHLYATIDDTNNRIKYNMHVTLINYTDKNSDKNSDESIDFYIVHPCLEIRKN